MSLFAGGGSWAESVDGVEGAASGLASAEGSRSVASPALSSGDEAGSQVKTAVLTWEPASSPDDNAGEATDREPSAEAKPEAAPSTPSTDSAQEPPPAKSDTESPEN